VVLVLPLLKRLQLLKLVLVLGSQDAARMLSLRLLLTPKRLLTMEIQLLRALPVQLLLAERPLRTLNPALRLRVAGPVQVQILTLRHLDVEE